MAKLTALSHVLGLDRHHDKIRRVLDILMADWGEYEVGDVPQWASEVSYDHTPMEISVALEGEQPELRFMVEPQTIPATLMAQWQAGYAINQRLAEEFNLSLERFQAIQDLFAPMDETAGFAMFQAFEINRQGELGLKVYLNPLAQGSSQATAIIRAALQRLGFTHAWAFLEQMMASDRDRLVFFSLDLSHPRHARVKVYLASSQISLEHLEAMMAGCPDYVAGDATRFCQAMLGVEDAIGDRPVLTCFAFTSAQDTFPYTVTLQVPLRDYVANDAIAAQRICHFLTPKERGLYVDILGAIANRPLGSGFGFHSFASFKRQQGQPRTTLYFALEAYEILPPLLTLSSPR